jgi:UDP-N-acetylglucosamine 1-carboxyvinyltransferase
MPDQLRITGGTTLRGDVYICGAKNAALKQLAATLLTPDPVVLSNLPHLKDVTLMLDLLCELGAKVTLSGKRKVEVNTAGVNKLEVPYEAVSAMRASIVVLGPMLARFKEARVALPGGCAIGSRPIDMHLDGLKAMGADIELEGGFVVAKAPKGLQGARYRFHTVTVTGTENLVMAATLANGTTTLENAACEPEVTDLVNMLVAMGAKITGIGTPTLTIEGVKKLHGVEHSVVPDRIEAGTYMIAAAMTGGCITVKNVAIDTLDQVIEKLQMAGATVTVQGHDITVDCHNIELKPVDIQTAPYPGLATDMQAQFMAMNVIAIGVSHVTETIFENRFMHVPELQRLGATIETDGNTAKITGVKKLSGAPVISRDLRASACLVLAALSAQGETRIDGLAHMDRGYEYLEEKLKRLGAVVERVDVEF